jgi:putative Mg2+ transporter-C (MgtC) family protein
MVWYEIVFRLFLAIILSGIIGFEREKHGGPAGLRTHVLVSVGAALVMLISIDGFGGSGDPARLAAQVVSGIGFLGAGAILRDGSDIKGITTATTLWIGGMIGLACGNGYYVGAIVATIFVAIFILALKPIEKRINNKNRTIILTVDSEKAVLATIIKIFDEEKVAIGNIAADYYERKDKKLLKLKVSIENAITIDQSKALMIKISEKINPLTIVSR